VVDDHLEALYAGRPRERCRWCGAEAVAGSVCPRSLACPACGARPGRRCKRPSEHDAAEMHAARWQAAERMDRVALGASLTSQPNARGSARATTRRLRQPQRTDAIVVEPLPLFSWSA
jgi:hypothetical protein